MRSTIYVSSLLALILGFSSPLWAAKKTGCGEDLTATYRMPPGWGISSQDLIALADVSKPMASYLKEFSESARFISSPFTLGFLKFLGTYSYLALSTEELAQHVGEPASEQEFLSLYHLIEAAEGAARSKRLLRASLTHDIRFKLATCLSKARKGKSLESNLDGFKRRHGRKLPPIQNLVRQSTEVQYAVIHAIANQTAFSSTVNVDGILSRYQDRIRGNPVRESPAVKELLDHFEDFVPLNSATQRPVDKDRNENFIEVVLGILVRRFSEDFDLVKPEGSVEIMNWVEDELDRDQSEDVGLRDFFRILLVEVVAKRRTLTGESLGSQFDLDLRGTRDMIMEVIDKKLR